MSVIEDLLEQKMRRCYFRLVLVIFHSPWQVFLAVIATSTLAYVTISLVQKGLDYHMTKRSRIGVTESPPRALSFTIQSNNFSFSRDCLRLEFTPLTKQDLSNATYDNIADFPCTRSKKEIQAMTVNDTEDIMCNPRPEYLNKFKNPCFLDTVTPEKKDVQTYCHPYFHILGFDKCGTTDFHSRLVSHPEIIGNFGGLGKEVYFWCWLRFGHFENNAYEKLRLWQYKVRFPHERIVSRLTQDNVQLITGDATPMDVWEFRYWLEDPQNQGLKEPTFLTPHAMRHVYENPKFIVLMRDPVERTYSDYMFIGNGFTPEKFAVDVPIAISMMTDCLRSHSTRQCFFSNEMYSKLPMRLHISCYSVFLREWLSVFDRRHFLFLRTEDYHNNTKETMKKAFHFLDVSELQESAVEKILQAEIKNENQGKKKAGRMFPETRAMLEEFFARFNEDLVSLLADTRFLWRDII